MSQLPERRRSFNIGLLGNQESEPESPVVLPKIKRRSKSMLMIGDIGKQKGVRNLFALLEEENTEEKPPSPNYFT